MKPLHTDHWQYYFAKPVSTGIFKFQADDFQVVEDLGYTPCGEGEHQFVFIEKMQQLITLNQPLPQNFAIAPMAEMALVDKTGSGEIITLLSELDAFLGKPHD